MEACKDILMPFIDLEKTHDRIHREWVLEKKGSLLTYIKLIKNMYD